MSPENLDLVTQDQVQAPEKATQSNSARFLNGMKLLGLTTLASLTFNHQPAMAEDAVYIGNVNSGSASKFCKRGSRSNSLQEINRDQEIITCRERLGNISYPISIGTGNEYGTVDYSFEDVCNSFNRFKKRRAIFDVGSPVYSGIYNDGVACYGTRN
jgi:hypothetical protein